MRHTRIRAAVAAIAFTFIGCTSGNDPDPSPDDNSGRSNNTLSTAAAHAASLETFDACPEMLSYLQSEGLKRVGPYGLQGVGSGGRDIAVDQMTSAEADSAGAPSARGATTEKSFSGTNVQEANVDEPDMVKTNGTYIYTTRFDPKDPGRMRLTAFDTSGDRPAVAGSVTLPDGAGTDLLLDGDRLLVLGGGNFAIAGGGTGREIASDMIYPPAQQDTIVSVIDVSDPTKMRVAKIVKLEGMYTSARMVDGIARIVLNTSSPQRLEFEQPAQPGAGAEKEALETNKEIAKKAKIEDWLPHFSVTDDSGKKVDEGTISSCSSTYRPKVFSGFQTTTVVTINPDDPDPRNSAAIVGGAGTIYASTENLYVATQTWPEPQPLQDRPTTGGTEPAIGAPDIAPADPAKTSLHRFDISDPQRAVYAASGDVRGTVLNQWSMSEHDGHLRVATTEDTFAPEGGESSSKSFVTVFDATKPRLLQVGQVGNIGPGERIYGVRFIGSLGYVVTFKQIDPLHVVDLTTPSKPKVLGELKIPGYSAYLHPVGDGLLLGVGQDVDPKDTRQLGTQVSLFDVKDPASPKRIDQVRINGGTSPIEFDHHAFTWWDASDLAIVPVSVFAQGGVEPGVVEPDGSVSSSEKPEQNEQTHVAIGYRIAGNQIREIGRANQARHVKDPSLGQIQRSIVVGDAVYTLSGEGLLASDLDTFDERGWVAFSG